MVVSERGCACSEWVAAGAAGDARAADGVAGESSMLPWEDAGLSHGFSAGRYCTHGFLLLDAREPANNGGRRERPKAGGGRRLAGGILTLCVVALLLGQLLSLSLLFLALENIIKSLRGFLPPESPWRLLDG